MIIKKRFSKRKFGVMSEALTVDMGKRLVLQKIFLQEKIWITRTSLSLIINLSNEIFHYYELE